jgi:hypothetical protein
MTCRGGPSAFIQVLQVAGEIALFVLPIVTLVYLVVRLRRRTRVSE